MNKKKHLTNAERIKIETLLSQGFSIRSIADLLEKSPSTISREIGKHSIVNTPNTCDCNDYTGCNVKHICGSKDCNKKCRSCHLAKKYCELYSKRCVNTGMVPRKNYVTAVQKENPADLKNISMMLKKPRQNTVIPLYNPAAALTLPSRI